MKLKEIFNDALPIIQRVAPTIASAIGGPLGLASGYVLPILASAFNIHPSNPQSIVQAILSHDGSEDTLASVEKEHGSVLCDLMNTVSNLENAEINVKLNWK